MFGFDFSFVPFKMSFNVGMRFRKERIFQHIYSDMCAWKLNKRLPESSWGVSHVCLLYWDVEEGLQVCVQH